VTNRPVASTMFAPGVPEAMHEFGSTNETLGSFVISVYLLGNAFGRKWIPQYQPLLICLMAIFQPW
jgi:hypothetical protein